MKRSIEYMIFKLPINSSMKGVPYEFVPHPVNLGDYVPVYQGNARAEDKATSIEILEDIFLNVNGGYLQDYYSVDMCSGDIIMLTEDDVRTFWYCDIVGWEKLS